jgi:hypothetical protein
MRGYSGTGQGELEMKARDERKRLEWSMDRRQRWLRRTGEMEQWCRSDILTQIYRLHSMMSTMCIHLL